MEIDTKINTNNIKPEGSEVRPQGQQVRKNKPFFNRNKPKQEQGGAIKAGEQNKKEDGLKADRGKSFNRPPNNKNEKNKFRNYEVANIEMAGNNKPRNNKFKDALTISFLGGVGEIGKNIMAVEFGNDIIVVDVGSSFPGDDLPGIDLVVPDITYLHENRHKIRGVVITHGHEDHIGSIPHFLKEINVPVYGSRLTCALIENKLQEHKVKAKLNSVKVGQVIRLGTFSVEFLKAQHSIGGAFFLAITCPAGVYFHTGDFKIDYTPVDGVGTDFIRLSELSKKGVLLLTSDSTNAERKGFSMSEVRVGQSIDNILSQNKDKRVFIATFASNIHRVQQLLTLAEKHKRKVAFSGRSMIRTTETASKIGEITFNKANIIDITTINKFKDEEVMVISTGTQGEPGSALVRMASGDFNKVEITDNDLIILSSSAIPGNEKTINNVMNNLYKRGAKIIYESISEVHTSGHAFQEELKTIIALLKPKYFIPVHGEFRQLNAHANLAMAMGMEKRHVLIPDLGDQVTVSKTKFAKVAQVPSGVKLVDGVGVSEVGSMIIKERMQLAEEGLCTVVITISTSTWSLSSKPDIISRGFIYNKENERVIEEATNVAINTILEADFKNQDWNLIKANLKRNLTNFFFRSIKRRPLILPIIIETK